MLFFMRAALVTECLHSNRRLTKTREMRTGCKAQCLAHSSTDDGAVTGAWLDVLSEH